MLGVTVVFLNTNKIALPVNFFDTLLTIETFTLKHVFVSATCVLIHQISGVKEDQKGSAVVPGPSGERGRGDGGAYRESRPL